MTQAVIIAAAQAAHGQYLGELQRYSFKFGGPGAPSQGARCCGGSPFGAVGAYATVIIDAVPGCQYTLCAGCAICLL